MNTWTLGILAACVAGLVLLLILIRRGDRQLDNALRDVFSTDDRRQPSIAEVLTRWEQMQKADRKPRRGGRRTR